MWTDWSTAKDSLFTSCKFSALENSQRWFLQFIKGVAQGGPGNWMISWRASEKLSYFSGDEMESLRLFHPSGQATAHRQPPQSLEGAIEPLSWQFNLVISCVSLGCLNGESKDSCNLPGSWILNHNAFPTVLTPLKSCSSFSKFFLDFPTTFIITPISIIHEGMHAVRKSQCEPSAFFKKNNSQFLNVFALSPPWNAL